jgi:hypothetical protein
MALRSGAFMQRTMLSLALSACFLALLGANAPADAALATFVSQTGNDAANCTSPATPCASFIGPTGALAKTDAGGVIHVAPGDYFTFIIDKAVEIVVDGGQASISGSKSTAGSVSAAIVVNAGANDDVRIRGFILDRHGSTGAGIGFVGGAALHLEDCATVNSLDGIIFAPTGASELYVSNSTVSDNGGASSGSGILIKPSGSGSAKVVLDNVHIEGNSQGILIDNQFTTGSNAVTIRNSTISGSASFALATYESGSGTSNVTIEASNITNNVSFGVGMSGTGATARLVNVTVTGNGHGLLAASSSSIISHGGNAIAGNTINGAFTATVPPQ